MMALAQKQIQCGEDERGERREVPNSTCTRSRVARGGNVVLSGYDVGVQDSNEICNHAVDLMIML